MLQRSMAVMALLAISSVFPGSGCSDGSTPPPATIPSPGMVKRVSRDDSGSQMAGSDTVQDSTNGSGNAIPAEPGRGERIDVFCDEQKLPAGLFVLWGWDIHSRDKRWRLGDIWAEQDALLQHLAPQIAKLQRSGIVIHGDGKAPCPKFWAGLALLAEFCEAHNIDLFKTIPTGSNFCEEFPLGALWIVQARPLKPATAQLQSTLLGWGSMTICDADRLPSGLLEISVGEPQSDTRWRAGDKELLLSDLIEELESRAAEIRKTGILICGLGTQLDQDARNGVESITKFCRRRNVDLFRELSRRGEYSREFRRPAICVIYSQPMKRYLSQFGNEYDEYWSRSRKAREDGSRADDVEVYWAMDEE